MDERVWSIEDPEIRWLLEATAIPTAAGREHRVIDWIRRWVATRPDLSVTADAAGNLVVAFGSQSPSLPLRARLLFITAHLDHPAFVVESVVGPGTLVATFRGGVMPVYFADARVEVWTSHESNNEPEAAARGCLRRPLPGVVTQYTKKEPFPECLIELEHECDAVRPGDVARWALPEPRVEGDLCLTHACDDLSAVAAALAVMERLRGRPEAAPVKLLFTRAEEIGFIGAIAACRERTMPIDSRVIALENSRSFAESPIGGGPVVRVGDRLSVFHPGLTGAIAKVAERLESQSKSSPALGKSESSSESRGALFNWQRKLMPGGACEASVFQAYGYEATCVCLPLGNYHNMADLERVQAGDANALAAAKAGPEIISVSDYKNMIALLEACALSLEGVEPLTTRLERVYAEKAFVLK